MPDERGQTRQSADRPMHTGFGCRFIIPRMREQNDRQQSKSPLAPDRLVCLGGGTHACKACLFFGRSSFLLTTNQLRRGKAIHEPVHGPGCADAERSSTSPSPRCRRTAAL